mmetsp:Transcript_7483/g.9745  ORF Transcript_7483/g.9745 Transcript_7483/m.9745 type:complete len:280 (+) Transcript_7483:133-972(+)
MSSAALAPALAPAIAAALAPALLFDSTNTNTDSDAKRKQQQPGDEQERGGKKKSGKTAAVTAVGVSPYDEYMTTMNNFVKTHGFLGRMLITDISSGDDDEDDNNNYYDEDEELDEWERKKRKNYTNEQMKTFRFILINKSRSEKLDQMEKWILREQAGRNIMMFATSFSYTVLHSWKTFAKRISNTKNPTHKLDLLMMYTFMIDQHDTWLHDNEGDMDTLIKGLANAWKRLLKREADTDTDLGWDDEYTKPAVMAMLSQFQQKVESMEDYFQLGAFKYN